MGGDVHAGVLPDLRCGSRLQALDVIAAAAHGQSVDSAWPDLQEMEGLKKFALQSRRLGFSGMSLIHPSQSEHVNAAFTPPRDTDGAFASLEGFAEAHDPERRPTYRVPRRQPLSAYLVRAAAL
jgi:hypothetical protein